MTKTRKNSPWTKEYNDSRYGTYEGARGTPAEWAGTFKEVWSSVEKAKEFLKEESLWDIIGVPAGSDFATVKAAFYKLIKTIHPDHAAKGTADEERTKKVLSAWQVLKDMLDK